MSRNPKQYKHVLLRRRQQEAIRLKNWQYCYKLKQLFRVTCFIAGHYNTEHRTQNTEHRTGFLQGQRTLGTGNREDGSANDINV